MADIGKVIGNAQILPDEIAKIESNLTYSYSPATDEKWYYKLTNVAVASPVDLIAGNFYRILHLPGHTSTAAPADITTSDVVKFLFIKNISLSAAGSLLNGSIYLSLNGSTTGDLAEITVADNDIIEIGTGESLALKLNCIVGDLHCEAGTASYDTNAIATDKFVQCIVAAIIKDV